MLLMDLKLSMLDVMGGRARIATLQALGQSQCRTWYLSSWHGW
ncbi:hypothetical protein [Mesorhizobium sp.]|nr:hypothetical protein [Mesorhizobium sp.]